MTEDDLLNEHPKMVQEYRDRLILEHGIAGFLHDGPLYEKITAQALQQGLMGFPLVLVESWSISDLAATVRAALSASLPVIGEALDDVRRPPNTELRRELLDLVERAKTLARDLDADTPALKAARRIDLTSSIDQATASLSLAICALETCSEHLWKERGKWPAAAMTELRTRQAHFLTPIFESAFATPATFNDSPSARGTGPWADFMDRLVRLISGRGFPNARGILKEARKRHKQRPIIYPPGFMPD